MNREEIEKLLAEVRELKCKTQQEVEEARVRLLGKKGTITALFDEFRTVDREKKPNSDAPSTFSSRPPRPASKS